MKIMLRLSFILLGFLTVVLQVCHCVKITKFSVPDVYILTDPNKPELLVLDCAYDITPNETGLVLKWLINSVNIYQFIPTKGANALSYMKNRVDVNYTVSDDPNQKHRALAITRPFYNMTGQFTCSVQTFQTRDSKSKELNVLVPANDLQLTTSVEENELIVKCSAYNIYPKPEFSIDLGTDLQVSLTNHATQDPVDGLFDAFAIVKVNADSVQTETSISCNISVPSRDYIKTVSTIYYIQTTTPSIVYVESSSEPSRSEAAIINVDSSSPSHLDTTITTIVLSLSMTCFLLTWLKDTI